MARSLLVVLLLVAGQGRAQLGQFGTAGRFGAGQFGGGLSGTSRFGNFFGGGMGNRLGQSQQFPSGIPSRSLYSTDQMQALLQRVLNSQKTTAAPVAVGSESSASSGGGAMGSSLGALSGAASLGAGSLASMSGLGPTEAEASSVAVAARQDTGYYMDAFKFGKRGQDEWLSHSVSLETVAGWPSSCRQEELARQREAAQLQAAQVVNPQPPQQQRFPVVTRAPRTFAGTAAQLGSRSGSAPLLSSRSNAAALRSFSAFPQGAFSARSSLG